MVRDFMEKRIIHPFPSLRAREIKEWSQSPEYRRILNGDYPRVATGTGRRTCAACHAVVWNVTFRFCPECGEELPPVTK
jgi:NADH pyrophosphatase NudC (nudix superfamily)